ncbi:MAG TPA: class I SAM-dependent methyltransferase [Geobacteraceae bacterium]|nr:class I SAM-dependent methyltransferase [Geobacteraceae bacterium]
MAAEKRNFDKEASTWDEEPRRLRLAADVADSIMSQVRLSPEMEALDYGCGTGLVTMQIQPHVRSITGADTSKGMLDVLARKAAECGAANMRTALIDPARDTPVDGKYNLIVSSMTLHHVEDVQTLFNSLFSMLLPGGVLCVADLDAEDGSFHPDKTGVFHFGFDRREIGKMLDNAGFAGIRDMTASVIEKEDANATQHKFPVFLVTAEKQR